MKALTLLLLYSFTLVPPAFGAITFDTASTATCAACSSVALSSPHAIGGGCTQSLLVVGTAWDSSGAVTLTSVVATAGTVTSRQSTTDGDGNHTVNFSSRVGASGSQSVTATFSGAVNDASITVTSYCGVDQTTPHGANATNSSNDTPVTVDLAAGAGEWVVDMAFSHTALTVGTLQTQRALITNGSGQDLATSDEPGPGTLTMSWDQAAGHYWGSVAVVVKAAAAAPTRKRMVLIQ